MRCIMLVSKIKRIVSPVGAVRGRHDVELVEEGAAAEGGCTIVLTFRHIEEV